MQYLGVISKMTEWPLFVSKANHSVSQWSKSMPQPVCWRRWSRMVLWRPTRPSRTNTQKRCPFHHRGLGCKIGSQEIPGVKGKFGLGVQNEAGQSLRVLPSECTDHSKHPLPTTQEMSLHMDITRWSIPKLNWLYSFQPKMEKLYTVSKTRPGADCGSDHELLIEKFILKLKKVRKTARPFRYDLNPLELYSGEVTNRFKGLDMIDCLKNYGQRFVTLYRRWW